eukprot:996612-Pelagomonas_calceolata.AAC.1
MAACGAKAAADNPRRQPGLQGGSFGERRGGGHLYSNKCVCRRKDLHKLAHVASSFQSVGTEL